jgi:XTP/dITP diphosphohydrolase
VEPVRGAVQARLASRNPNKLRELASVLDGWELELLDADSFPPEEGVSYLENARAKARFGRAITAKGWVVGEDSGIEVDALGGAPGIHSARWAGDGDPVEELLAALEGVTGDGRRARYVCELVCLSPELEEFKGRGKLEGTIAHERRGSEGFGYDPVFVPDGQSRTVAELGNVWKARNSHRARAARALLDEVTRGRAPPRREPPGGPAPATSSPPRRRRSRST